MFDTGITSIERGSPVVVEHHEGYPSIVMVDEHGCMTGHEPMISEVYDLVEASNGKFGLQIFATTSNDITNLIILGIEELYSKCDYDKDSELRGFIQSAVNISNIPSLLEDNSR